MKLTKVKCRIFREGKHERVHFCYIDIELRNEFNKIANPERVLFTDWVERWAAEDFDPAPITTWDDLENLRHKIKELYKNIYPNLFLENITDRQGWVRIWCTNHMKKELGKIGN